MKSLTAAAADPAADAEEENPTEAAPPHQRVGLGKTERFGNEMQLETGVGGRGGSVGGGERAREDTVWKKRDVPQNKREI